MQFEMKGILIFLFNFKSNNLLEYVCGRVKKTFKKKKKKKNLI